MENSKPTGKLILIDDNPYCLWDLDVSAKNMEFLDGYDAEYFEFTSRLYYHHLKDVETLSDREKQYMSFGLRSLLSQATEALFALIGATLQSPDCVYGWLFKYKISELNAIVDKINSGSAIRNRLSMDSVSWDTFATKIFQLSLPDEEKETKIRKGYASFWRRLALDYRSPEFSAVYNSMKHGFRAQAGGMFFSIGKESTPGVPAEPNDMISLGGSKYGASYYYEDSNITKGRTLRLLSKTVNWSPKGIWIQLSLIRYSITNILSFLKVANGKEPKKVQFLWPDNLDDFNLDLETTPKALSFTMNLELSPDEITYYNKTDLLEKFDQALKNE